MKPTCFLPACLLAAAFAGCTDNSAHDGDDTDSDTDSASDSDTEAPGTDSDDPLDVDLSGPGHEFLDAATSHPLSLDGTEIPLSQVPMFIVLGIDDNGIADTTNRGGATWIREYLELLTNPDGSPARASFYMTGKYGAEWVYESESVVLAAWRALYEDGHEIGVHSMEHLMYWNSDADWGNYDGRAYTLEEWAELEFNPVMDVLTATAPDGAGIPRAHLRSWRTPRLEWNNVLFTLLDQEGIVYDCSIESDPAADPQNEYWPFTLDNGCPFDETVESHPGLWELPAYAFHIPPSLQDAAGTAAVTGLDYNVLVRTDWGGLQLSGPQFTEILQYNLDQRMLGNRCPLLVGLHSDIYTDLHEKNDEYIGTANARERQLAVENFIAYALATYPEVRFVSGLQLVAWLRNPSPVSD